MDFEAAAAAVVVVASEDDVAAFCCCCPTLFDDDDDGDDNIISIETLTSSLQECEWIIRDLDNQGEDIDRLLGYEFNFLQNGMLTFGDGITSFDGTWEVGTNDDGVRVLLIQVDMQGGVSLEWPLVDLAPNAANATRLVFEDDNGFRMVL